MRIVDRKKDMIIVSGFKVFPNEIESVVAEHPAVLECGCIGVPDPHSGQVVKMFVVVREAVRVTIEELTSISVRGSPRTSGPSSWSFGSRCRKATSERFCGES